MPKTVKGDGGKRHPLNMRTTQEMRERLEAAAAKSGRSLAQEVEYRLNASFGDEERFPHPALKFWAYFLTGVFHGSGQFAASMRDQPDMTIPEWMADPLIYQTAMFDVILWLIRQQPRPTGEKAKMDLLHLNAMMVQHLQNDLLGIDLLKATEGKE